MTKSTKVKRRANETFEEYRKRKKPRNYASESAETYRLRRLGRKK